MTNSGTLPPVAVPADGGFNGGVLSTLETLIAPGRRARLSPFVEAAQYAVLFGGDIPDPVRWSESSAEVVRRHRARIEELAGRWDEFATKLKPFAVEDYQDRAFRDVYLAYYFSLNIPKIQLVLLDLVRQGALEGRLHVLDVGVGTGTTAVAVLDFILAWGQACELHGVSLPVTEVQITGLDRVAGNLDCAAEVVRGYAGALARRIAARTLPSENPPDSLRRVHDWAQATSWQRHDLEDGSPAFRQPPNLVIVGNVLSELSESGQRNLERYLEELPDSALISVIEPGAKRQAQQLMRWRRRLVTQGRAFEAFGPCGREFGNGLPSTCETCWNSRREAFHQTPLYRAFRGAATRLTGSETRFSEFENQLLSWSYVVLRRGTAPARPERSVGSTLSFVGIQEVRYIGTYRHAEDPEQGADPVGSHPDEFFARPGDGAWTEYLRLCPADYAAEVLAFQRRPGFQVLPLRFGQRLRIGPVTTVADQRRVLLRPLAGDETRVEAVDDKSYESTVSGFIPAYSVEIGRAVDEIAHRLFGFEGMRDFQHRILGQVLTGRDILGIAATGGGKSECFILPAMILPGVTVVVSPLRSLMQDQYEQRIQRRYGLDHLTTYINSDVKFHDRQARLKRMELGYYKLVYFTPEQLERGWVLDFLERTSRRVGVRYLAMDEAHCISQWGHDFRPAYLNILRRLDERDIRPVRIALTATASPQVRDDICEELHLNPAPLDRGGSVYVHSSNRPELNLLVRVRHRTDEKAREIVEGLQQLLERNAHNDQPDAAILFMPHTGDDPDAKWRYYPHHDPEQSSRGMKSAGVTPFASYIERRLHRRVAIYHGKMEGETQAADVNVEEAELPANDDAAANAEGEKPLGDLSGRTRQSEQTAFIDGARDIMVATKGFGMGIDKPNVRLVIHRTPTPNLESYAQEAGRAGRDGQPSSAILYFSPDRSKEDEDNPTSPAWSDHDIQQRFLTERYIRSVDVTALRDFLLTVERKLDVPGSRGALRRYLYFTNDEVIEFLERHQFTWPRFQRRHVRTWEPDDHAEILDRGHVYDQRTRYVGRILSVLYRIRPTLEDVGPRLAFLETVHRTGASIRGLDLQKLAAESLVASNMYFGARLRGARIRPDELRDALQCNDLFPLAARLKLPMHELATMLEDMKYAEGYVDQRNKWRGELLDYWWISPPKVGPARDRESLRAWREYAGATTRASLKKARENAQKKKRSRPETDDWFSWSELYQSVGWEVELGEAFGHADQFDRYLAAFMDIHDRRQQNDWDAYRRLLTDYVGVTETGAIPPGPPSDTCLRAVMLGYLKSHEVVMGGNCLSCNRCIPNEDFSASMEERRRVVVRLGAALEQLMEELESCDTKLPATELVDELFLRIEEERQQGHSLAEYVAGWSARLLQDQADHVGATWVRHRAMVTDLIEAQPHELVANADRLSAAASPAHASALRALVSQTVSLVPREPNLQRALARLSDLCADFSAAATHWQNFVDLTREATQGPADDLVAGYQSLRTLYQPAGPCEDAAKAETCSLAIARLAPDADHAVLEYEPIVQGWDWPRVEAELHVISNETRSGASAAIGLLVAWVRTTESSSRTSCVADHLERADALAAGASPAEAALLVDIIGTDQLELRPAVARALTRALLANGSRGPAEHVRTAARLCRSICRTENDEGLVERLADAMFTDASPTDMAVVLIEPFRDDESLMEVMLRRSVEPFRPRDGQAVKTWFDLFPAGLHSVLSDELVLDLLRRLTDVMVAMPDRTKPKKDALNGMWELTARFLSHDEHGPNAHALWMQTGRRFPWRLEAHIDACCGSRPEWADEAFAVLLRAENQKYARAFLDRVQTDAVRATPRIRTALDWVGVLDAYVQMHGPLRAEPEIRQIRGLRQALLPQGVGNIEQADLLVAVARYLHRRLPKRVRFGSIPAAERELLEVEGEALCVAFRLVEAEALARQHTDLRVRAGHTTALLSALASWVRTKYSRTRSEEDANPDLIEIARLSLGAPIGQ